MISALLYALGFIVLAGVVFLGAALLFGRGEDMPALPAEGTPTELPDLRPVTGSDVRTVRLPVTVRGYRMADTDWVLDRLAEAVDERDREIARLHADLSEVEAELRRSDGDRHGPPTGTEAAGPSAAEAADRTAAIDAPYADD